MGIEFKTEKDKKNKNFKYRIFITLLFIVAIYGIFTVNMNLADLAKKQSAFSIEIKNNPVEVVLDLGERQIIFSTRLFKDFKEGSIVIFKAVKEQITSLMN